MILRRGSFVRVGPAVGLAYECVERIEDALGDVAPESAVEA